MPKLYNLQVTLNFSCKVTQSGYYISVNIVKPFTETTHKMQIPVPHNRPSPNIS